MYSDHEKFAKTVLISSLLSVGIFACLLYIFKDYILEYARQELVVPAMSGETSMVVTQDDLVTRAVERANEAVVSVQVLRDMPVYEQVYQEIDPYGFFGRGFVVPRVRERGVEEQIVGRGSGFIVNEEGMIVTNRHVVEGDDARFTIVFPDGKMLEADLLVKDDLFDIAILQLQEVSEPLPYVTFGNSDALRLGETVIAIGNALGEFQNSVSVGVVSGLSRSIVAQGTGGVREQLDEVIQTDAAINVGNSGGPLLSIEGTVVGINVARSIAGDNIAFSIPGNIVKTIIDSVVATGEIKRPFLGVRYQMITPMHAETFELEVEYGALVVSGMTPDAPAVIAGSPADMAGLKEGDVIISIDDTELRTVSLAQVLRGKQIGDTVKLRIVSEGSEKTVEVVLEEAQ